MFWYNNMINETKIKALKRTQNLFHTIKCKSIVKSVAGNEISLFENLTGKYSKDSKDNAQFTEEYFGSNDSNDNSSLDDEYRGKTVPKLSKNQKTTKRASKNDLEHEDIKLPKDTNEFKFDRRDKNDLRSLYSEEYLGRQPQKSDDNDVNVSSMPEILTISKSQHSPETENAAKRISNLINEETTDKVDLAFALAEDFVKSENLAVVGDALFRFNGIFYELFPVTEIQRMFFKNYKNVISKPGTVTTIKNATTILKLSTNRKFDEFPINKDIIVFNNGTLEVATMRFRPNSPEDIINTALGINYDPNVSEMPYIKQFITTIANFDRELYKRILQVLGYILSNDLYAKSFFYLQGLGDTGKSLFCALLTLFFPESGYNKVARIPLQNFGDKFALANLVNAKLNISEDLPNSPLTPTTVSRIKMISDSNRIEVEPKYVQPFSIKPQCKLLFASNHPLRLKEFDEAFENRVIYLPFVNVIPKEKQDKQLLQKMKPELPALFNHALKAYKMLVENNYIWAGTDIYDPAIEIVKSGINSDKTKIIELFLKDLCEFEKNTTTATEELRCAYDRYCRKNKYIPIAGDRFSRELANILPDTVQRIKIGNQKRGYRGIKLKAIV